MILDLIRGRLIRRSLIRRRLRPFPQKFICIKVSRSWTSATGEEKSLRSSKEDGKGQTTLRTQPRSLKVAPVKLLFNKCLDSSDPGLDSSGDVRKSETTGLQKQMLFPNLPLMKH